MQRARTSAVLGLLFVCAVLSAQTPPATPPTTPVAPPNATTKGVRILEPTETPDGPGNAPTAPPTAPVAQPVVQPPTVQPVVKACPRPFAQPDLTLADGPGFDRALAARLRTRTRVVVDLPHPYPQGDAAPAPLATWLAEVDAAHGSITVQPYCTRSAFGDWVKALFRRDPHRLFRPVQGYDVILHADGLDQVVTQVEFVPHAPAAS